MSGKLRIQNEGEIQFGQWSTSGTGPANPSAGYVTLYSQGSQIKAKDQNGNITVFGSSGTSYSASRPGLYSHCAVTTEKLDVLPTPKIVAALKAIGSL